MGVLRTLLKMMGTPTLTLPVEGERIGSAAIEAGLHCQL